jgi:hypothetical protein
MARKHRDHGHERGEQDHLDAAAAHEAEMAKPLDERLAVPPCAPAASRTTRHRRWACGRSCPGRGGKGA